MTKRVEENEKLINSIPKTMSGNKDDVMVRIKASEHQILIDISKSLAALADYHRFCDDELTDADLYVRDHMLIEFMQSCLESGTGIDTPVEEWYEAWQKKLKELEERHG